MILSKKENIEYYLNGNFKYIETIAIVSKMWIAQYPNHRINSSGKILIRVGVNKKFKYNGKLEWELKYDDCGNIVSQR